MLVSGHDGVSAVLTGRQITETRHLWDPSNTHTGEMNAALILFCPVYQDFTAERQHLTAWMGSEWLHALHSVDPSWFLMCVSTPPCGPQHFSTKMLICWHFIWKPLKYNQAFQQKIAASIKLKNTLSHHNLIKKCCRVKSMIPRNRWFMSTNTLTRGADHNDLKSWVDATRSPESDFSLPLAPVC